MTDAKTILVVDDEANLRKVLSAMLRREGFDVLTAADGAEALDLLARHPVEVVLTDLKMPHLDGMALLERVNRDYPGTPVVMLTAHGTVDTAVTAMKLGAFDYLTKPFDKEELQVITNKAAASADLAVVLDFVCEELCGELLVGERVREPSGLIARRAVVAGNGDVFFGIRRRRVDAVR